MRRPFQFSIALVLPAALLAGSLACSDETAATPGALAFLPGNRIAAGNTMTCALDARGRVLCWGGLPADSGDGFRSPPTVVDVGAQRVVSLSSGINYGCALLADGTVRCWGSGFSGSVLPVGKAVEMPGVGDAIGLPSVPSQICAIRNSGTVACWAATLEGVRSPPEPVGGLADVVAFGTAWDGSCAVRRGGDVVCEDSEAFAAFAGIDDAVDISMNYWAVACVTRRSGRVVCSPEAGAGLSSTDGGIESRWNGGPASEIEDAQAVAVAAGGSACALLAGGTVRCWGENNFGGLGAGDFAEHDGAVQVPGIEGAVALAAGQATCVLLADGSPRCWGSDATGAVGRNAKLFDGRPRQVAGLPAIRAVSAGGSQVCAVTEAGRVLCWGAGRSLEALGRGPAESLPADMGIENAVSVATGAVHACATLQDGKVVCWGRNMNNKLGREDRADAVAGSVAFLPSPAMGVRDATAVSVGDRHSCATTAAGLWCWGGGPLGLPAGTIPPGRVPGAPASGVAAGRGFTCALGDAGEVFCWGSNAAYGASGIGDGTTETRETPVKLTLPDAKALAAGTAHACALTVDGDIWCWGSNAFGQLGIGNRERRREPVRVPGIEGATAVGAGDTSTCAVLRDSTVRCWGFNGEAQLGDGTLDDSAVPVTVRGLDRVVSVSTGDVSCALRDDASVWCWGSARRGQLGDGRAPAVAGAGPVVGIP